MRFPFPTIPHRKPMPDKGAELAPPGAADEESYDDANDHALCDDCNGSGWYTGLVERRYCPTCDGSGYL